jgi:PAS domain S-box-containing protein
MLQSLRSAALVATAALGLLLLTMTFLGYRYASEQQAARALVDHTYEVIDVLQRLQVALSDAETGQRDFLLTGDDRLLRPFHEAEAVVPRQVAALRRMTAGDDQQALRVLDLDPMITTRLGEMRRSIALPNGEGPRTAAAEHGAALDLDLAARIRTQIGIMIDEARRRLSRHQARSAVSERDTIAMVGGAGVIALLGLLLAARSMMAETASRRRTAADLGFLKEQADAATHLARAGEARLSDLAATVPGVLYQWYEHRDGSRGFRYVSPRVADIYGVSAEAWLADWRALPVHPDDRQRWAESIAAAVRSRSDWSFEGRFVLPNGEVRWWRGVSRPIQIGEDELVFNGIIIDIQQQKAIEAELAAAANRLTAAKYAAEAANEAKSRFLAMMSHELRTPMTGVLGLADLLALTPLEEDQQAYLASLRMAADSFLQLLNDILDFSKIEADELRLEVIDFDLGRVVSDVMRLLDPIAAHRGNSLDLDFASDVPRALRGDPTRLRQVFHNLVGNAIKFTENGRVLLTVREDIGVDGRTEGKVRLRFEVRDSGIGIEPEHQSSLFRPFAQADQSTTRRFGGTGLGLAISRSLVQAMGGEIGVASKPDFGSTFWFAVTFDAGSFDAIPEVSAAQPMLIPSARPRRILLAEDNDVNRMLIGAMLQRMGHQVVAVANGAEAVEAVRREGYDLVLMDMQMPVMDGASAIRAIRTMEGAVAGVPIIALTADARTGEGPRLLMRELDGYLTKPVDWMLLGRMIDELGRAASLEPIVKPADPPPAGDAVGEPTPSRPPSRLAEVPLVDRTRLAELRALLGAPGFDKVLVQVPAGLSDAIAAVRQAHEAGDSKALRLACHALKGAAASFGIGRVLAILAEIAADEARLVELLPVLDEVPEAVAGVLLEMGVSLPATTPAG